MQYESIRLQNPDPDAVARIAAVLGRGGVVALPTDTVYGLAAHALDAAVVGRVFAVKGRGFDKPIPVVVRDLDQAAQLAASLPEVFFRLAKVFWPGPLTLIVPARASVPAELTAGTGTIGIRQPDLEFLQSLLRLTGFPLTATSANRSQAPACTTAAEVEAQLGDRLDLIVDGGPSPLQTPSTVVDLCLPHPRIVRAGAVAVEQIEALL